MLQQKLQAGATSAVRGEPLAVAALTPRISYNCYSKSCLQAGATSPVRGEPDFGKLAIADSAGGPTHKLAEGGDDEE